MEDIMHNAGNCSVLMIRSHHTRQPVSYYSTELLLSS
jgi:hypothetical protein